MRLFRVHRQAIGVLAACLLAMQGLFAAHMPMSQVSIQDPVLGEIVICSASGTFTLKDAERPSLPSQHKPQCPCCMAGCLLGCAGGAAVLAPQPLIVSVVAVDGASAAVTAVVEAAAGYLELATIHARAPPLLIG